MKDFSRAYDINPRYHDAYFYVGRTAFEEGDIATALKIFRHVLDYQPNRGNFRYFMGRALQLEGRDSQALDEYRKATAVDPAYGLENPAIYIHRGRLLSKLGYSADGRSDIAKALEIAPDMPEALLAMADSNYSEKAYDSAIANFSKALEQNPDNSDAQYKLGMSLIYTGKQREGAQRLQLAIKYGFKNPEVYRTLGYLYKDLGQRKLALESFQTFMQETKDQEIPIGVRREMLRQIQELGG
jgi:tetratricopeptide (TPR) repeat protein